MTYWKGEKDVASSRAILIECKDIQMRHQKDEKEGMICLQQHKHVKIWLGVKGKRPTCPIVTSNLVVKLLMYQQHD
jgi:hypothetical protein